MPTAFTQHPLEGTYDLIVNVTVSETLWRMVCDPIIAYSLWFVRILSFDTVYILAQAVIYSQAFSDTFCLYSSILSLITEVGIFLPL